MKELSIESKNDLYKELFEATLEYQALLIEELDELAIFATAHHWKSSRIESGEKARKKIIEIKEQLNLK